MDFRRRVNGRGEFAPVLTYIVATPRAFEKTAAAARILFPRVAAVIHHGGAGTTAAAARAGVPQVITPMFSDQFYWARRIVALGVGAATPHATLTTQSLTSVLEKIGDQATVTRARALASRIEPHGASVAARRLSEEFG